MGFDCVQNSGKHIGGEYLLLFQQIQSKSRIIVPCYVDFGLHVKIAVPSAGVNFDRPWAFNVCGPYTRAARNNATAVHNHV